MEKISKSKKNRSLTGVVAAVVLSCMMLAGGMTGLFMPDVVDAADASKITTWGELKEAIEVDKAPSVTITKNLYADESIEINYPVEITGSGDNGVTIYQKKRGEGEKYDTMFKVTGNGDLTLGEKLTLTGETGCSGGGGGGNPTAAFKTDQGYLALVSATQVDCDGPNKMQIEVEIKNNKGYIIINYGGTKYYVVRNSSDYMITDTFNASQALYLTSSGGGDVTSITSGTVYRLFDPQPSGEYPDGGYLHWYDEYGQMVNRGWNLVGALEFTAEDAATGGGDQTCDNECGTYTTDNFDGGTSIDAPKGFFVQVDGGKATLDGATLKNFITSRDKATTPKFVAPVAVKGETSTFDIKSGEITNNIVGYIVDDGKANENANAIKMYVKGAAPNAQRASGSLRRGSMAGIDDGQAGSGITATAGAVIYTKRAQGTVSGGSISLNRGDTGGIMASGDGTKVTLKDDIDINNNVGVQFGGGVTTEDGAFIAMEGGSINQNVAWFGGGAVYATENGVKWLLGDKTIEQRETGWFTMGGGALDGNTSFTRGGAILADSDGVSLIKGNITNNMARMLGGAIYVMGDHPDFTYTVYIEKGYVHENKAVSGGYKGTNPKNPEAAIEGFDQENNLMLSRKLNGPNGCTPVDELFDENEYMTTNSDDTVDGYPGNQKDSTDGTGGGVWLCSYGNTTLDLSNESQFYINDNTATGSVRSNPISGPGKGGDDLHKDTKNNGSLVITGIDRDDNWVDQNSGEKYTSPDGVTNSVKDTAMRNLINNGTKEGNDKPANYDPASYDGVDFYGNLSRRGGALAADGSFVFGKTQNIAQLFAEMSIEKDWKAGTTKQPIVLKVFVETANDKIEFAEVPLSQEGTEASELDVVFDEGNYKGRLMLPAFVEKRNEDDEIVDMIQVFDIKVNGSVIDLNSVDDLETLATAIQDNPDSVEFSSEGRKITFEEYIVEDGKLVKTDQFQLSPAKISLGELGASIKTVIQKQTNGDETEVVKASFPELKFNANITNDKPAEIEKYVNEAVHKPIALDEVFTYDILAYVKQDADKLVITDKLVNDLEFVSEASDVKLYDLGLDDDEKPIQSNHKPTNDVSGAQVNDDATVSGGTEITNEEVEVDGQVLKKVDINDQTLTVTLANLLEFDEQGNYQKNADTNQLLTPLRGHWVRVSFQAQIKKEYQDKINAGTMKLSELQNVKIKAEDVFKPEDSIYGEDENRPTPNVGNKPVESDEDHDGIINTASYAVSVANEPTYKDESNTVTVKPKLPEIEKYVNQAVHKNIALDEVFTYDIIGFVSNNADTVIFEDQLESDLEFADPADVTVTWLKDNNHKPKYDIEGKEIADNDDASVASEEWEDIDEAGLDISVDESNGKLTVTIDDEVKVNPETGDVERKYENVQSLRGRYVKVSFKAQIKKSIQDEINAGKKSLADLSSVRVAEDENAPVDSEEAHKGIMNEANLIIKVGNKGKYDLKSNKVTVKPEQPEIEKYVNQAVHDFIDLDETFTYDIVAFVTRDADKVTIKDKLDAQLQFVSKEGDVKVVDLGEDNNHKVTNNINAKKVNKDASVAEKGKAIEKKTVSIEGDTLTITLDDETTVKALRGHWVKVTFDAKIKDGLGTKDLEYTKIDAAAEEDRATPNIGNSPVVSRESHDGVPNKASYTIDAEMEDRHSDESNTVTVKPEEFDVEISKHDLEGNELPGAEITITDEKGKLVEKWTSEDKPHKTRLKPGKYKLREVVAPEGFNRVTTIIEFEVDEDGVVTVLTAKVDNGGEIEVLDINHLVLTDAPKPTISKTVNGGDKVKITSREETFDYTIKSKIAYIPDTSFAITDAVPMELEIVSDKGISIEVNGEALSEDIVSEILKVKGNTIIVSPTMEMMNEWGPFEMSVNFSCKIREGANVKGKNIKNVAYLVVDGEIVEVVGGKNEATVNCVLGDEDEPIDDEQPTDDVPIDGTAQPDDDYDKNSSTGDNTSMMMLMIMLALSGAIAGVIVVRRRITKGWKA